MSNSVQTRILQAIEARQDEVVGFLSELVAIPSVTGEEAAIQEFLAARLKAMGLDVDMWDLDNEELSKHPAYLPSPYPTPGRPNVVAVRKGSGNGRSLLFNGHVDVIPVEPLDAWERPPFSGQVAEGRLHGRGSSDMKSGLAAMIMAVDALVREGVKLKGDVILECVVDEESTGNGTLACVQKGIKADAGICCETSSMHIQPACIGRIWFEIFVKGKPAGIQKRFEGVSAIELGQKLVRAVSELEAIRIAGVSHPLYPDRLSSMPCMVGKFQAGTFASAFPDTCLLTGSIATLPCEDTAEVKRSFTEHILAHAALDPWMRDHLPEVRFKGYCGDPAEIDPGHPIVTTLVDKYRTVLGAEPSITGRQGAADTRYLIKYGDTPTVIFGPGLTEQMHAANEWVRAEDLVAATKILALTIMEWCGVEG